MQDAPILYSFRRCPYAMRARMAIVASGLKVELREIHLKEKPAEMLIASPKATVPVLVLGNGEVIDESLDIMKWALQKNDRDHGLNSDTGKRQAAIDALIFENDSTFKQHLDHYKYADRFPAFPAEHYRQQGESFLKKLEIKLQQTKYLFANTACIADIAIFPFIRQFAYVDKDWFDNSPYLALQQWLAGFLESSDFAIVMRKNPVWKPADSKVFFPTSD